MDGPTTQAFQNLLCGKESLIIYGLTERDGDNCYISAPVVSANGVLANYRKTHLWWKAKGLRHEPTYYRPGDRLVTFNAKGHRCGIMICYDRRVPKVARRLKAAGADFIVCPAYGIMGDRNREFIASRAKENRVPVLFVHPNQTVFSTADGKIRLDRRPKDRDKRICIVSIETARGGKP